MVYQKWLVYYLHNGVKDITVYTKAKKSSLHNSVKDFSSD